MSWMIGIYVGESFAEIAAKNNLNGEISFNRWFLPQLSIEKGIEKFLIENKLNEVSEVRWMTRFGRQVIHKGLGHNPALLVTEGFESWPFMNLPIDQIHFSAFPEKQKPPIQSHLIFGISERVNSKGEIDKKLDTEELEFLVSKLQLNKIEHVAIGLIHSNLNPSHEKLIEEYLKERGFKVFPSYKFNTSSSEKPRWWSSVLNAYLEPSFNSLKKSIQNGFESQNINCEIKIHHSSDIYNDIDGQPLNSLFGPSELFSSISQDESKAILYFGIEEFLLIPAFNKNQKYWNAPFGRVAINHRPVRELKIQPTTPLEPSDYGCPFFNGSPLGFEPGPICFGRALKPLFLDLLFLNSSLDSIEHFKRLTIEKSKSRIEEALRTMNQIDDQDFSSYTQSVEWLNETAINLMASEIRSLSRTNKIETAGPLTSIILPMLETKLPDIEFKPLLKINRPISELMLI